VADSIIPETTAVAHFVELADSDGRLVLLPRATVHALRAMGQQSLTITLNLTDHSPKRWLTVTEAAEQHLADLPPAANEKERRRQLLTARANISRACSQGQIKCVGDGQSRRLDPDSLAAWRLKQRDRYLQAADN